MLGGAAAVGLGIGDVAQFAQIAGNVETGVAAFAGLLVDAVFGQREALCLQGFLQAGFRIFGLIVQAGALYALGKQAAHHGLGGVETGIEADGGKHGLHGVGQNGRAVEAAAFQFARPQKQGVAHGQTAGDVGQHVLVDQVGAQAGKLAFAAFGKGVEQHARDGVIEDAVADKLETLVVAGGIAAVGECLFEQLGPGESVAETGLKVFKGALAAGVCHDGLRCGKSGWGAIIAESGRMQDNAGCKRCNGPEAT